MRNREYDGCDNKIWVKMGTSYHSGFLVGFRWPYLALVNVGGREFLTARSCVVYRRWGGEGVVA